MLMRCLLIVVLFSSAAIAQDDLYVPKPSIPDAPAKPDPAKPKHPKFISGLWTYTAKCSTGTYVGTFNIKAGSNGTLSGLYRALTSEVDGTLTGLQQGSEVRVTVKYADYLGDESEETYAGTLNEAQTSFGGKISGGWGAGCRFTAEKG